MQDNIVCPEHYTKYSVEVIEIARYLPFCLGNVVKYVLRAPFKNGAEDCDKALQYLAWCSLHIVQGTLADMTSLSNNIHALCDELREDNPIEYCQQRFLLTLLRVLNGGFYEPMHYVIEELRVLLEKTEKCDAR